MKKVAATIEVAATHGPGSGEPGGALQSGGVEVAEVRAITGGVVHLHQQTAPPAQQPASGGNGNACHETYM